MKNEPLPRLTAAPLAWWFVLALAAAMVTQAAGQITWLAPEDGGTPRDASRIRQVGPREFHIRAAFEEGGSSSLRHAVSRVDLLCRNAGVQPVTVTLHLDLSDDGKRTDYDTRPESGMRQRDFVFIQPPGRGWQQVDGATERWVATVRFEALPGETKVGLSPWYTYGDYLRFVNGLPKSDDLQTRLVGKSDGGREHWELTITDPAVAAEKKRKIFWHAREHAYETHPDGRYRLDLPDDVEWAKATARFIKANDPYRHLVTVHPVISSSTRGATPRSQFDPPWRIGGYYGESNEFDVLSQQTSVAYGAQGDKRTQQWFRTCAGDAPAWFATAWDEQMNCWTGDVPGAGRSIAADRVFRKPVLNTEFGCEYLRGHPNGNRQVHHNDKVRRTAWRIVCAGGYPAAGFLGTLGHSDVWNRIDAPNHYGFTVKDEGAASQLGALHDFFAALPFWRMQPCDGVTGDTVALAEPGKIYVVYLPHGGSTTLDLSKARGSFAARWFNPRTGTFGEAFSVSGEVERKVDAPEANDWVLLLEATLK